MKPFIISHGGDIDGASPVILCNMVFGHVDYALVEVSEVAECVKSFLENPESQQYDMLYITDLGLPKETCELLQSHKEWRHKVRVFDHHASNLFVGEYDFATVVVTDANGVEQCGTTLFYQYLKRKFPDVFAHNTVLEEYVELVRQLDTWCWFKNGEVRAKQLGQLFDLYGKEKYIEYYTEKLKQIHHFYFSEFEEQLLEIEELRIQNYVAKKAKEMWKATIDGHPVGIVFAEKYRSELGNELALQYEKEVDFIAIVNAGGGVSFRSCNDKVDLGKLAKKYGGGGHKRASGCEVPELARISLLEKTFPGIEKIERLKENDEN